MFDVALVVKYLPMLLDASVWTIVYSLSSVAIGFCIGTLMCAAGLSRSPVGRGGCAFYVSFFRGVPLLVQLLISYYCLPLLGVNVPSSVAAVGTLALCTGAYIAEILRGGFLGIPPGLVEAAREVSTHSRRTAGDHDLQFFELHVILTIEFACSDSELHRRLSGRRPFARGIAEGAEPVRPARSRCCVSHARSFG